MKFKGVILLTVLVAPALVFIFLKQFGSNQFDLEVYYQNGIQGSCSADSGQHFVDITRIVDFEGTVLDDETLLGKISVFYSGLTTGSERNQIARIMQRFSEYPDMQLIGLCDGSDCVGDLDIKHDLNFGKCELGLSGENAGQLVLVDKQLRIRGYYVAKLDGVDRLITESFVLKANE